jgi:hypothetical protein
MLLTVRMIFEEVSIVFGVSPMIFGEFALICGSSAKQQRSAYGRTVFKL